MSMHEFARQVGAGMLAPLDRLGQKVKPGQLVLYTSPVDLIFETLTLTPMLDPRAPMGMARLTVTCQFEIQVAINQQNTALIVLGQAPPGRQAGQPEPSPSTEAPAADVPQEAATWFDRGEPAAPAPATDAGGGVPHDGTDPAGSIG
jgi:hypothetical protein